MRIGERRGHPILTKTEPYEIYKRTRQIFYIELRGRSKRITKRNIACPIFSVEGESTNIVTESLT